MNEIVCLPSIQQNHPSNIRPRGTHSALMLEDRLHVAHQQEWVSLWSCSAIVTLKLSLSSALGNTHTHTWRHMYTHTFIHTHACIHICTQVHSLDPADGLVQGLPVTGNFFYWGNHSIKTLSLHLAECSPLAKWSNIWDEMIMRTFKLVDTQLRESHSVITTWQ